MPPTNLPSSRQRPKSPNRVLAEAEAQWLFTPAELANTPSIQDGMPQAEELELRAKGVNFIVQVGIMLKLPQLTLSTAAVFFQRFLMRASLKKERNGIPKLHHFATAATALFLATKVEESCRKMKEMVLAFCRVAQKNPNLLIDEQSKDWWKWRDNVLFNEDVLLEVLCFDLTIESPHRLLVDLLRFYAIEHNKPVRNAAWAFVTDSNATPLCLLFNSRTIAIASLYAACRLCSVQLDDVGGKPWWEAQGVRLKDVREAVDYMCQSYDPKISGQSRYAGLSSTSPEEGQVLRVPQSPLGRSERRGSGASSVGVKREFDGDGEREYVNGNENEDGEKRKRLRVDDGDANGALAAAAAAAADDGGHEVKRREEAARVEDGDREEVANLAARNESDAVKVESESSNVEAKVESSSLRNGEIKNESHAEAEGSEEGEVEE